MPAVYGNGARIVQTPNAVVISYEMVHDTRVIPLDNRPPLSDDIHLFMGDSRGHWEGDTLVVESRNFTDRTAVGGARHSEKLHMTERFTRIDPEMIDYEIHVDDPDTFAKPWTMRMTITSQPDYQIYEYGCHEGNNAMRNALSAERAYEKAAPTPRPRGCRRPSACSSTSTAPIARGEPEKVQCAMAQCTMLKARAHRDRGEMMRRRGQSSASLCVARRDASRHRPRHRPQHRRLRPRPAPTPPSSPTPPTSPFLWRSW